MSAFLNVSNWVLSLDFKEAFPSLVEMNKHKTVSACEGDYLVLRHSGDGVLQSKQFYLLQFRDAGARLGEVFMETVDSAG